MMLILFVLSFSFARATLFTHWLCALASALQLSSLPRLLQFTVRFGVRLVSKRERVCVCVQCVECFVLFSSKIPTTYWMMDGVTHFRACTYTPTHAYSLVKCTSVWHLHASVAFGNRGTRIVLRFSLLLLLLIFSSLRLFSIFLVGYCRRARHLSLQFAFFLPLSHSLSLSGSLSKQNRKKKMKCKLAKQIHRQNFYHFVFTLHFSISP